MMIKKKLFEWMDNNLGEHSGDKIDMNYAFIIKPCRDEKDCGIKITEIKLIFSRILEKKEVFDGDRYERLLRDFMRVDQLLFRCEISDIVDYSGFETKRGKKLRMTVNILHREAV